MNSLGELRRVIERVAKSKTITHNRMNPINPIRDSLRDRILNILSFLSQSLQNNKDLFYDGQEIWEALTDQGYSEDDIESAVETIEKMSLKIPGPYWSEHIPVCRVYSSEELSRLPSKVRGYLWTLKCRGIIDHTLEDEILQRAMNLEGNPGIREIKTVAALTIFGYEHKVQAREVLKNRNSELH